MRQQKLLSAHKAPGSTAGRCRFPGNACLGCVPEFAVSSEEREKGIASHSLPREQANSLKNIGWF